jgi:hypothetical protein
MSVSKSIGGMSWPLQSGQSSPQPMPLPVMRTIPPKTMRA